MRIIKRKKQKWTTLTRKVCHSSNFKTPIKSFINDSLLKNLAYTSIDPWTLRVHSHEKWNELIPVWDFKPAWKQVLFTWSFISATFQSDTIFWWTCVGISFRVVFTWYFFTRNEISFLSKWPIWNPCQHWVSDAHAH